MIHPAPSDIHAQTGENHMDAITPALQTAHCHNRAGTDDQDDPFRWSSSRQTISPVLHAADRARRANPGGQ